MRFNITWAVAGSVALYVGCLAQQDSGVLPTPTGSAGGPGSTTTSGDQTSTTASTGSTGQTSGAGGSSTVSSGTAGAGGATGAGGAVTVADSGSDAAVDKRAMDLVELRDALKNLNGFIYTSPCKIDCSGIDVTTQATCTTAAICWATAGCGRFAETRQIAIGGAPGHVYEVDLNVLGVIEPRDYPAAPNCAFEPGQPLTTISIAKCTDGFANSASVTFNVYQFAIPAPAAKYYLNAVQTHPPHRVDKGDNKFTFTVNAGTTITFTMDDLNGGEIRNCTNIVAQSQYTTAPNSPFGNSAPIVASSTVAQPFNGNWYQLSVIDARVK